MILYVLRRLGTGLVLAVLVTLITFLLLSTSFDSIVTSLLGSGATEDTIRAMKADLGMDRPVLVQYADWLSHVARGDLGASFFTAEPVDAALSSRLSVTLSIVIVSLLITVAIGVALGVIVVV